MTLFCINTIRRFILRCKFDQCSATQIGDAVNKYHRQNELMVYQKNLQNQRYADFEGFFGTPSAQIF